MQASEYYCRQTVLKEVGPDGQRKLEKTRALVVGAGGLGHPVATYLAAAGVGQIAICDFDQVEASNLNRQVCFLPEDIGSLKAEVLATKIGRQNPFIRTHSLIKKIDSRNVRDILEPFHLILDCCDNMLTKYLIHDTCWAQSINLVQAAIYQYEGQLQVFPFSRRRDTGCLRCLWNDIPAATNCQQAGLIGAVAGILGTLQAGAAVRLILGLEDSEINQTCIFNLLTMDLQKIRWNKRPDCPMCSGKATLTSGFEVDSLTERDYCLVDIREDDERSHGENLARHQALRLPLSRVEHWKKDLEPQKHYLFLCARGIRSAALVESLRREGWPHCYSLAGGLEAL